MKQPESRTWRCYCKRCGFELSLDRPQAHAAVEVARTKHRLYALKESGQSCLGIIKTEQLAGPRYGK